MNQSSNIEKVSKDNKLSRAQQIHKANIFRTFQHNDATAKFNTSLSALKEYIKFLSFISDSKWPNGMETSRTNLFQSTTRDDAVPSNRGN